MSQNLQKLNLVAANLKKMANIDIDPKVKPDLLHDLEEFPYPFC